MLQSFSKVLDEDGHLHPNDTLLCPGDRSCWGALANLKNILDDDLLCYQLEHLLKFVDMRIIPSFATAR